MVAEGIGGIGPGEDEIAVEEGFELGVGVKLLTQQYAAPSASAEEVEQDQLVFGLGFGDRVVQGPFEPGLGRGE